MPQRNDDDTLTSKAIVQRRPEPEFVAVIEKIDFMESRNTRVSNYFFLQVLRLPGCRAFPRRHCTELLLYRHVFVAASFLHVSEELLLCCTRHLHLLNTARARMHPRPHYIYIYKYRSAPRGLLGFPSSPIQTLLNKVKARMKERPEVTSEEDVLYTTGPDAFTETIFTGPYDDTTSILPKTALLTIEQSNSVVNHHVSNHIIFTLSPKQNLVCFFFSFFFFDFLFTLI